MYRAHHTIFYNWEFHEIETEIEMEIERENGRCQGKGRDRGKLIAMEALFCTPNWWYWESKKSGCIRKNYLTSILNIKTLRNLKTASIRLSFTAPKHEMRRPSCSASYGSGNKSGSKWRYISLHTGVKYSASPWVMNYCHLTRADINLAHATRIYCPDYRKLSSFSSSGFQLWVKQKN